jgi:hypothetical protein
MNTKKSKPGDQHLIYDENAPSGERASAIFRLGVDGFFEMELFLAELFNHPEPILRGQSITVLLGLWKKKRYLDHCIQMLHNDVDGITRSDAAFAMGQFAKYTEVAKEKKKIVQELTKRLQEDVNEFVQKQCYQKILETVIPDRRSASLPGEFNRQRDVDWELLKSYLDTVSSTHQSS